MRQVFDYVVVGGGSGGCVMAGRLSEDPSVSVCVLEAGGGGNSAIINTPAGAVAMLPTKLNNWAFETTPQSGLNGRKGYQPRGKALGGSSAVNAMVYIRGQKQDYDHWAALGNAGWSYDEVLPYFKLSESNERIHNEYHGQHGPLSVSDLRTDNPFQQDYLAAAREAGYPVTDDFNGADQEGVGIYQVTQKHGERWSAARAYLLPHMDNRENLVVHTHALVQKIEFQGKRAVAVEVEIKGQTHRIEATREIILAAGAFQTPQLLMVSGVGDSSELASQGIECRHHLPGVGKNLHDHPDFIFGYKTRSTDNLGVSLKGSVRMIREMLRYKRERRGMLSSNFAEGGGFLKTDPTLASPDVQLHFVIALVDDHARNFHMGHGFSCHVCLLQPKSRGSVGIQSKSMKDAPVIDIGFYQNPEDLEVMVKGYKLTQKLMQAPSLAKHVVEDSFTANVKTDDDIREILRNRTDTVYHPVGTCKMGNDDMAVVDAQLRVRGLEGLRIVDCSVMPTVPSGNTNAPMIMMAEKTVDIIRGYSRVAAGAANPTNEQLEQAEHLAEVLP
ncbi:GMC family oxidoreductase [Limnobacter litoralis]|uniref:Oxidoreductase n=1 Tax=Limnobacter litoralis TaxID=481366 RepID=A0ABQ5YQ54_9BURK|nr:GMC family oxidoreductase N-terminal domain-containing protein [Limnobacter litoralis]GLR26234.1 oxidoreductase [Limnobacter litoralis]